MSTQVHPELLVKTNKHSQSLTLSGFGVWLFVLLFFGCPGLTRLIAQNNEFSEMPGNPAFIGAELYANLGENGQTRIILKKYYPISQSEIPTTELVMMHERMTGMLFQRVQLQLETDTTVYKDSSIDCSTTGKRSNGVKPVKYVSNMELPIMPGGFDLVWMQAHLEEISRSLPKDMQSGFSLAIQMPNPFSSPPNAMPETGLLSSNVFCFGNSYEILLPAQDKDGDELTCVVSEPFSFLREPTLEPGPNYTPEAGEAQSDTEIPLKILKYRPPFQPLSKLQGMSNFEINSPSASLDKKTGILTFTPDRSGTYLIGITLSDTRKGEILSSHQSVFLIEAL